MFDGELPHLSLGNVREPSPSIWTAARDYGAAGLDLHDHFLDNRHGKPLVPG
jgi:hypothetical protein